MNRKHAAGIALLIIYVASIVGSNVLTTRYGLVAVFPGLVTTAGTVAVGGVIMTRDLLQDALGRLVILAAIVTGAGLSWLLSAHQIAAASGITFLVAETIEFAVYTPLRRRCRLGSWQWARTVGLANATGAVLDTLLFLTLAGFPLTWPVVGGQLAGKAYVTVAVVAAGMVISRVHMVRQSVLADGA